MAAKRRKETEAPIAREAAIVSHRQGEADRMRSYVVELIGTFFLVLTIGVTVIGGQQFAAFAIAAVVFKMLNDDGAAPSS